MTLLQAISLSKADDKDQSFIKVKSKILYENIKEYINEKSIRDKISVLHLLRYKIKDMGDLVALDNLIKLLNFNLEELNEEKKENTKGGNNNEYCQEEVIDE